jgi:hypothetical protein
MMAKKKIDQIVALLQDVTMAFNEHDTSFAIGLDMAANEDNWGICLLLITPDLRQAKLVLLLPQAYLNKNGRRSATRICRPSFQILQSILQSVFDSEISGSMGIDVPFGWPVEHGEFVGQWSATEGWQAGDPIPERQNFEKRLCDVKLNQYESAITPFAVGADTIAQAAYKWAACRHDLAALAGEIHLGLTAANNNGLTTFESYPGAFVQLAYPEFGNYKSQPEVRRELLEQLRQDYPIQLDRRTEVWLEWAIEQRGRSPDAFDALLCAITAWAHRRWMRDQDGHPLTTPARVFTAVDEQLPTELQEQRIHQEGWILIPG